MPLPIPVFSILQHTPVWVWGLLLVLVALGLIQAVPRSVTLRRATLPPLALASLSLWGVVSVFGDGLALAAWAGGVVVAATLLLRRRTPQRAVWSAAEERFQMPGSWGPLALILGIFCIRYVVGVSVALHPGVGRNPAFGAAAGLNYGVLSGLLLGRAVALWRIARGRLAPQPA